jgi:hypothetical protein
VLTKELSGSAQISVTQNANRDSHSFIFRDSVSSEDVFVIQCIGLLPFSCHRHLIMCSTRSTLDNYALAYEKNL